MKIDTLDNPGWLLKVDLRDTPLEGKPFGKVVHGAAASELEAWKRSGSWWVVEVKGGVFEAACGPLDLATVLSIFPSWAGPADDRIVADVRLWARGANVRSVVGRWR